MTRGLIYGAVDASLSEEGGVLGLLERVVPQVELPLRSLALSPGRRTRLASIAFGLGLGLYSARPKPKEKDKSKSKSKSKDRKSTRLNSSHVAISYAVFCLTKKTKPTRTRHW